ncbi:tRNA methyl transferase-like protein [Solidesulfovibrio fructosivorans JJ]]|uniref:7-cyano-7-deazaguanine synthase n=1 Tax=Solidesulfovibrio fructosivorans JJ] TaxID=596151 RepID=E1JT92_SOLFR|nr:7-cyano-7-deazaguanine synthase [Solidesulfovibrio fructosivorans]EFL52352.1 tRNA methyl transferase-like protein [Solidesulfovibrio fructosivorans JJ]]
MKKVYVLLSGGIDSSACAHFYQQADFLVEAIFFSYGQAASAKEEIASKNIADHLGIHLTKYNLETTQTFSTGELIGRNAFFIFSAIFFSRITNGSISLGIHAGTTYYDCSAIFFDRINKLVNEYTNGCVNIQAPFLKWTKNDIYQYFLSTKIPIELTYSCELGSDYPCGRCASCRDRKALGC